MWYIFKENQCISTCDNEPNQDDLGTRGEISYESNENITISEAVIVNGEVTRFTPAIPFSQLQEAKIAEINLRCQEMIIGGFTSSALGSPHRYDSDIVDQLNFDQAYTIAKLTGTPVGYRVWREDGTKPFIPHTASQFETAYMDGAVVKAYALQRCAELKVNIANANSTEELEAIIW